MKRETMIWTVVVVLAGAYLLYRAAAVGSGRAYARDLHGTEAAASAWEGAVGTADVSAARTVGVWVAAILTLCILSFLYRDNPFYKTAESLVVGVSAAYWMVVGFWTTLIPNLFGKLFPGCINAWAVPGLSPVRDPGWFVYFFPLALGVMLLWRLAPKGAWIARWPLAFIIGTTAGIRLVGYVQGDFLSQIRNTIRSLIVEVPAAVPTAVDAAVADPTLATQAAPGVSLWLSFWASAKALVLVAGVLACLVYFFFSVEHKGAVGKVSKVGIWYLMITFGAAFGYTVMGRIALLAMRLEFLFDDWLWLIDPRGIRPPYWSGW
jgi:hypothetical protein